MRHVSFEGNTKTTIHFVKEKVKDTRTHLDLENPDFAQRQKSADIAGGQQQLISENEAHVCL
jgi:hypothetical protein